MKNKYRWITLFFTVTLFIMIMIFVLCGKIQNFDSVIYQFLMKFKSDNMTIFMKSITKLANTSTIIILCLASLTSLLKKYKGSLFLLINMVISTILNLACKNIICRERPEMVRRLIEESGFSFPSGHAMASVSFYGFIIFLVINSNLSKTLKTIISALLSLIIIFIGISRVYLGVHYPSDVVAGYLFSFSLLIISTYYIKRKELL